eukprot:4258461-Amphidinium_carterae.1
MYECGPGGITSLILEYIRDHIHKAGSLEQHSGSYPMCSRSKLLLHRVYKVRRLVEKHSNMNAT